MLSPLPSKPLDTPRKDTFLTPQAARAALLRDKLGTVYRRVDRVVVITRDGSGTFATSLWDESDGDQG